MFLTLVYLVVHNKEWMGMGEWGNGMIITSDYGSFPHSLLSTSKYILLSVATIAHRLPQSLVDCMIA